MNRARFSPLLALALGGAAVAGGCKTEAPEPSYTYVYPAEPAPAAGAAASAKPFALALTGSPSKGPANAKVTIVEVSDFQ